LSFQESLTIEIWITTFDVAQFFFILVLMVTWCPNDPLFIWSISFVISFALFGNVGTILLGMQSVGVVHPSSTIVVTNIN
jgi:hypothetical protein